MSEMVDIAQTDELPRSGNKLRSEAIGRARVRLGLDERSAAYIPASNVLRNGEEYVLKVTKQPLNKMLSPADGGAVPLESIVVLDNPERIANNGVYYKSEGDRKHRQQISGYDHLITTVYIDMQPYLVDMRVRVLQETPVAETQNILYYFTPEEIVTIKKVDTEPPTGKRHAPTMSRGMHPLNRTIPLVSGGVKRGNTQKMPELFSPHGEKIDTFVPWPYNEEKGGIQYGGEEAGFDREGILGDILRQEDFRPDARGEGTHQEIDRGQQDQAIAGRRRAEWAIGHIIENPQSPNIIMAVEHAKGYVSDVVVVEDGTIRDRNPSALALTSNGVIHLSDGIPPEVAQAVAYHEVVHAIKQRESTEYLSFLKNQGDRLALKSVEAEDIVDLIVKSRFGERNLLELSELELRTAYDELNAVVWGFYKDDPENARARFAGVFTDYDAYISELDAIMERVRRQRAEGPSVPDRWDKAIEEGFADEKSPNVKREEDIDRSWEAGVVDTEAQEQASLLNAIIKNGQIKLEDVRVNSSVFEGETAQDIADVLVAQGYQINVIFSSKSQSGAQIIRIDNTGQGRNITQVQISPGGGRHGPNPYVKISTSDQGIVKIVFGNPQTYITDRTETATIIFAGGEWYD